jgi:two-component system sensor histidine kinase KdpD
MATELTRSPDEVFGVESTSPAIVLAAAAHELRLPLSHIKGFVSSLRRTDISWDRQTTNEFLEEIELESDRLGELIDSLLAPAAEGQHLAMTTEFQPTAPAKLVQSALHRVRSVVHDRPLGADVPVWLPAFRMQRDAMERVIANLIENAVKYSPDGSPIELSAHMTDDGELEVVVADHGAGVPLRDRERIFQPFYRSKTRVAGHGLGLAIAFSIVKAHGGQITVNDRPGGGACFILRLPAHLCSAYPVD